MAIRRNLFSKWLLKLVVFQLICTIGLSVGSEDDDLGISSSKLEGSSEDLKSDFIFELERQSLAGSPSSKLKTSEELKLKKNGNLLEDDEYIVQDDESEDDEYIVQDNETEDGHIVNDDESEGDGYIVQDDNNIFLEPQSEILSKSTSNVHTPDDNSAQSIKPFDDSNDIPTGRKDVYHYGNASPKTQSSGKHQEASKRQVSDDEKTDGVDTIQPPKKSKLSTWEKAQLMMMKRNKNKMEKGTQQKGDEIVVDSPLISRDVKASSLVSEKRLDFDSDSSQRNESSEVINEFPQSGKFSSNDVDNLTIEESREKFIKQPDSVAQEDRHESVITADSDIDNNLKSRKDTNKEVPHQDQDSEGSDSKISLTEDSHLSKNIKSEKDEDGGRTIDQEAGNGISENDIDASQGNDKGQDKDDAGGRESDDFDIESESISDLENVKEVKNDGHNTENRDSTDGKVSSSSKDDLKYEVSNSSNSEDDITHNLMNKSISDVKDAVPKPTKYVEKSAVDKVNITSDVLTRDELKVDFEYLYPDDGTGDITANDTDGDNVNSTKDIKKVETDDHGDNTNKNKDESETVGNVALFDKDTLDSQMERPDDHSAKNQNNLVDKNNGFENIEDEKAKKGPVKEESNIDEGEGTQMSESLIKGESDSDKSDGKEMDEDTKDIEAMEDNIVIVEDFEEINKDSHSSDSAPDIKNSSELSKDVYDGNDIKQVNESGAKEGPVKEESNIDEGEGTQMSESLIRGESDSDKSDGKEMDEDTKDIETKEDNIAIVEDDDEKPKDGEGAEDEDTENDEDVEGTDEQQADNYVDEEEDINVDDEKVEINEHIDNDAKEVEDNNENGPEDVDSENVVLEIDAKLSDYTMDKSEQNVNDDTKIEKVHRSAHKEGEVNDNAAKDGDEKVNSKSADGKTKIMEVIGDKDIEKENKLVVDKLPNNEDENISDKNKSPKKEEQIGDKKGHKDVENVEVSLDSSDVDTGDESENETRNESFKDDEDEIRDVDDFEGIKNDNSIAKNGKDDEVSDKDDNNNEVNEKDSKMSIGSALDTSEIVNKASSNHTKARNATYFEQINSNKMQKDDSFGEGITDSKSRVNEDNQTSSGARASEGRMSSKEVIDGGDAPGLTFEDVPTYVEITRDHDEQGIDDNVDDGTINVDVDGGADGPVTYGPTFAPSLSNRDATADSEEIPIKAHEKDSETSVNGIDLEKLDVSTANKVVDSLNETSDFEPSVSQEADKENAENKHIPDIVDEDNKDISNVTETIETSDVENEEVMPDSIVATNDYEVYTNVADERKTFSTPEAQEHVPKEGSYESHIESDEKNLDGAPQEPGVSNGQFFPDPEHVKVKDESQSAEDDSDFSDIPSQIDNLKTEVDDEKATENKRVVNNEYADDYKKLSGTSEEVAGAKDGGRMAEEEDVKDDGKMAEEEDVKDDGNMVEDLGVKDDGKMAEDLDVKDDGKMAEDLDVKDDGKMAEEEDVKDDGKMVEDLDVKDDGKMEEVEKYFQDTTLQSTKRDWVFFTIKPYITLLKTIMKKLDPFITGIIFMLPPSLQNIFLKAPFNMYPTHAFLLFILSCLSLFVISFSKIFKGNRQHSKSKELKEMLFETKGVLLLSQVERDEAEKKLQDLKAKLKQKDDDLESGTAELNKNLKALIKECDTLKEEVSRRMGSSKEMKSEMKKAESDIQKQSLANKELQESVMSAKSQMQQLQDKREQLQSSVDESELNSMKLEEKIQCLSEDLEAVEESYDQLRTEVESKLKESGDLQTTVDLLKKSCSKKSGDIETKEKENKILREAISQLKVMKHLQEDDENDDDDDGCDDDKKKERLEERIKHLIYIAQMRSRIDEIEEEKESLKKSLTGAAEKKMDLNDELKKTMEEMEKVEQLKEDAERQTTASTMKIEVLSDYYKQREKEYNKMLQEKEAKEKAISSQKKSANERYKEVDKMVADYKNQVEVLTQELERIGIHYEKQMALQENKLQENLVFVKQTERDYNIKVKEAEIMRQKLLQYKERISLLESMMASHKSTETLNASQTKEDVRSASRNLLLRENMPSPPNFMPPPFSPHPPPLGPIQPPFFNPPPYMMRHPFIPPRLPMRSREDSPTLQRIRDLPSDNSLDERDHYPSSRTRSPLRFGPSPACRNRSSPVDLKDKYTPLANNRPLDPFYMEKGDGSHRTKYSDK